MFKTDFLKPIKTPIMDLNKIHPIKWKADLSKEKIPDLDVKPSIKVSNIKPVILPIVNEKIILTTAESTPIPNFTDQFFGLKMPKPTLSRNTDFTEYYVYNIKNRTPNNVFKKNALNEGVYGEAEIAPEKTKEELNEMEEIMMSLVGLERENISEENERNKMEAEDLTEKEKMTRKIASEIKEKRQRRRIRINPIELPRALSFDQELGRLRKQSELIERQRAERLANDKRGSIIKSRNELEENIRKEKAYETPQKTNETINEGDIEEEMEEESNEMPTPIPDKKQIKTYMEELNEETMEPEKFFEFLKIAIYYSGKDADEVKKPKKDFTKAVLSKVFKENITDWRVVQNKVKLLYSEGKLKKIRSSFIATPIKEK